MGCEANKTEGAFGDTWEFVYGNQFNKSFVIKDDNGVAMDMSHITSIDIDLFLTKDFSAAPFATLDSNWQNEDPETGVIEATMEEAVVNALVPEQDFAWGRIVLTDALAGAVDYIIADALFKYFPTSAVRS